MRLILILIVLFIEFYPAHSQVNTRDTTIRIVAIDASFGFQMPGGDLAKRFGNGGITGLGFGFKTRGNWMIRADYQYIFGRIVKEDTILKGIMTKSGYILNNNAEPVLISIYERGFMAGLHIGKVLPVFGANPNSGVHLALGGGFMQHRIRIVNNFVKVPQLTDEYKKGYDRLSNGLYLSQQLGYQHISNYHLTNFFIGAQATEGFTENRRTVNYDTGFHDGNKRLDIVFSLLVKWYIPLYKKRAKEFYFY